MPRLRLLCCGPVSEVEGPAGHPQAEQGQLFGPLPWGWEEGEEGKGTDSFWAAGPREAPSLLGAAVGRAASCVAVRENWLRRLPKPGPNHRGAISQSRPWAGLPGSRLRPGWPLHTDKWLF